MRLPGGGRTLEGKQLLRGNEYIRGYQHLKDQPASKGKNALAGRINLRPRIAGLILSAKQLKDATSCRTQSSRPPSVREAHHWVGENACSFTGSPCGTGIVGGYRSTAFSPGSHEEGWEGLRESKPSGTVWHLLVYEVCTQGCSVSELKV